jgi:hypothetical protein
MGFLFLSKKPTVFRRNVVILLIINSYIVMVIGVYMSIEDNTMPIPNDQTRWTVSVSKETDTALRCFLAQRGMKKGDMSKFIEESVRWRVFDQSITEARSKFADVPANALQALIDEATQSIKNERR